MNALQLKAALNINDVISYDDSIDSVIAAVLASNNRDGAILQWAFSGLTDSSNDAWTNSLDENGNTNWTIEEAGKQLAGHVDCCTEMLLA